MSRAPVTYCRTLSADQSPSFLQWIWSVNQKFCYFMMATFFMMATLSFPFFRASLLLLSPPPSSLLRLPSPLSPLLPPLIHTTETET